MSNQNPRFVHVANNPRLRYSVAYNFEKTGDELTVTYGIAQCNRRDNFNRAEGRRLSAARLAKALKSKNQGSEFYGQFKAIDVAGVSVASLVRKRFENDRNTVLKNVEQARRAAYMAALMEAIESDSLHFESR